MKLYDGFAILGMLMASLVLLWFLVDIFFILRYAVEDTMDYPFDYKTPVRFIENVCKHAREALKRHT